MSIYIFNFKDSWTTEALIDRFTDYIIRVRNNNNNNNNNKYLTRVADFIGTSDWSDGLKNTFRFDIADILFCSENTDGERTTYELMDLYTNTSSSSSPPRMELDYVLHQVLKRLFALCSASWFFDSAETAGQISVRLMP